MLPGWCVDLAFWLSEGEMTCFKGAAIYISPYRSSCVMSHVSFLRSPNILSVLQSPLKRLVLVFSCSRVTNDYFLAMSIEFVLCLLGSYDARVIFEWIPSIVESSCRQQDDDLNRINRTTFVYFMSVPCGSRVVVECSVGYE